MSDEVAVPEFVRHVDAPGSADLHLQIRSVIDARIDALKSVALVNTSSCCSTGTGAVEQLLTSLRSDRALLGEHWAVDGPTRWGADEPAHPTGCGLPQPCPHTLALARTYGVRTR